MPIPERVATVLGGRDIAVSRVPVDTPVDVAPPVKIGGDVTHIVVSGKGLVAEMGLFLKEDVHVGRRASRNAIETPAALRRQRAVVQRTDHAGRAANEEDTP